MFSESCRLTATDSHLNDIMTNSHVVVYHKSKLEARVYFEKTSWNNRWRYNAFYEGGFKQYMIDEFKRIISNLFKRI